MKNDVPAKVINRLFDNGYEEQIIDIVQEFEDDNTREVSDIPLSPSIIQDSGEQIIISPIVYEQYQKLVSRISNSDTAQEIPFILLGNKKDVYGKIVTLIEDIVYCVQSSLDDLRVTIDEELFRKYVADSAYSVVSIGHTHGNVSEDKKRNTLTSNISNDIRQKYDIRDVGLNISVSDIWQQEAFKYIASNYGNKEIMQTVIMYNGDIIMLSSNGISKSNNIQTILSNGELITLSTGTSNREINKQMK